MTISGIRTRGARLTVLIIALGVLACWAWTFRLQGHDWGGDFSLYIAHARNIALGRPYAAVNYIPERIVEKDIPPHGPPTYPPVFPLVLAPVYRLAGLDYAAMRAFVQALWLAAGALFYVYGRQRGLGSVITAAAIGVFLLSSLVLSIKDSVVSESTYLVVSATALIFFEWVYRRDQAERRPLWYGAIAGVLVITAYLTRATGIALVAAFLFYELYRTRRLRLFGVAAGVVFVTGFLLYRSTLYDGSGYSNQFRITPETWARNAADYFKSPASLWAAAPAIARYPAAIATLAAALIGFLGRIRRGPAVAEFYVVLYMIPLLLYSSGANMRYIMPIYPIILLYCADALTSASTLAPRFRRPALAATGMLLIAGAAANVVAAARAPDPEGPEIPSFQEAASRIRKTVAAGETVVSWNPRVVALYTERLSTYYRPIADPVPFGQYLEDINAKWVLEFARSDTDARWLSPYIARHPDRFERVWSNTDFHLYRLQR
jgi:hypothetical protein